MARKQKSWPEWWEWELELSAHLLKRMIDRQFSEVDLRGMLERAAGYSAGVVEGRWMIHTRHGRKAWTVIVEPDRESKLLVVVTAFPMDER